MLPALADNRPTPTFLFLHHNPDGPAALADSGRAERAVLSIDRHVRHAPAETRWISERFSALAAAAGIATPARDHLVALAREALEAER